MMVKLTALFGQPESTGEFEKHYVGVHIPLARKIPHVVRIETARSLATPGGDAPEYYRIAELWFDDVLSLDSAMKSPEGAAAAADIAEFATGGVTLFVSAIDEA